MNKLNVFLISISSFIFLLMFNNLAVSQAQNQTMTVEETLQQTPPSLDSNVFGELIAARQAIQDNNIYDAYGALNALEQQLLNVDTPLDIVKYVNQARQALQYNNNFHAYRNLNLLEQQLLGLDDDRLSQSGGSGKSRICNGVNC